MTGGSEVRATHMGSDIADNSALAVDIAADWATIDALIGEIYECALDPLRWDDTLARIVAALAPLEWDVAFLLWEGPGRTQFIGSTGVAAGVAEIYAAVHARENPWSRRTAHLRAGTVVDTADLVDSAEFASSSLSRDFLSRWGMDRALIALIDRSGGARLALVMPGPSARDLDVLTRALRVLAPHIQRAVRISRRIAAAELDAAAARSAADRAVSAILCLTADLGIVTANLHVDGLEARGVVRTAGDRLAFCDPAAQRQLSALAARTPPASAAFTAADADGTAAPVLAARVPSQSARALGGSIEGTVLIVTIGGPVDTPALDIGRLGAWYGLTPAEGRLAAGLANGAALQEYAATRNVSVNAVRFLLKSVFRKVGVTSQAELLGVLGRLPSSSRFA